MSNSNETFTYQIHPARPIRDLIPGKGIRKPVSLQLTKDEVMHAMKYGPVYRVFPGKDPIRVTGSNIDELHRPAKIQEIKQNQDNSTENKEIDQIQEDVVSEDTNNDVPEEHEEISEPENEEIETPVEDNEEEISNDTLEVSEEEDIESDKAEATPVEKVHVNPQQFKSNNNYNKYNSNKKKHH